jgi:hypothetical protein
MCAWWGVACVGGAPARRVQSPCRRSTAARACAPCALQERYVARHLKAIIENGIAQTLKASRTKELLTGIDQLKTLVI